MKKTDQNYGIHTTSLLSNKFLTADPYLKIFQSFIRFCRLLNEVNLYKVVTSTSCNQQIMLLSYFLTFLNLFIFNSSPPAPKIWIFLWTINLYFIFSLTLLLTQVRIKNFLMENSNSSFNNLYAVPLSGTKQPGFTQIYRNPQYATELQTTFDSKFHNVRDVLVNAFQKYQDRDMIGAIKIKPIQKEGKVLEQRSLTKYTYKDVFKMVKSFGSFIIKNQLCFTEESRGMKLIGICSKNRMEWNITDFACILYGFTLVPFYDTFGVENLTYCLQNSGIRTLIVGLQDTFNILKVKNLANLKNLICLDKLPAEMQAQVKNHNLNLFYYEDILNYNQIYDYREIPIDGKLCTTFSYSSGTTGSPKAIMLSHDGILSAALTGLIHHKMNGLDEDDVHFSYLPLAHLFARAIIYNLANKGGFFAVFSGDIMKSMEDMEFIKPTRIFTVPRLYQRMIQKLQKQFPALTQIKSSLIEKGVNETLNQINEKGLYKQLFSTVRRKFGGRVKSMLTGSAPIRKETFVLMRLIMGCEFYQGYGTTENTTGAFMTDGSDPVTNQVGGPTSCHQYKLSDIPQMGYLTTDIDESGRPAPRGEIWLRGPSIFMGYYKDQEKTRQMITEDGWLKTGDVGVILPGRNALKIIDRKKNIFKLQQGQYIAPEKIQNIYLKSPWVKQVFLHGQSFNDFAVAIIFPKQEELLRRASENQINGTFQEICKDHRMRALICKDLINFGKNSGLLGFEQAKNIWVQHHSFIHKDIGDVHIKLSRFELKKYFNKEISSMYNQGILKLDQVI